MIEYVPYGPFGDKIKVTPISISDIKIGQIEQIEDHIKFLYGIRIPYKFKNAY